MICKFCQFFDITKLKKKRRKTPLHWVGSYTHWVGFYVLFIPLDKFLKLIRVSPLAIYFISILMFFFCFFFFHHVVLYPGFFPSRESKKIQGQKATWDNKRLFLLGDQRAGLLWLVPRGDERSGGHWQKGILFF